MLPVANTLTATDEITRCDWKMIDSWTTHQI
jgi:hypothetical protein